VFWLLNQTINYFHFGFSANELFQPGSTPQASLRHVLPYGWIRDIFTTADTTGELLGRLKGQQSGPSHTGAVRCGFGVWGFFPPSCSAQEFGSDFLLQQHNVT